MRNAYALLGLAFLIVFAGAYVLFDRAYAPAEAPVSDSTNTMSLILSSSAFAHNETIPSTYTCDGDGVLPPLSISGVPEGAVSLVLVMDDPDIPAVFKESRGIDAFDHFVLYNIPPDTTEITADGSGEGGLNSRGETGYVPPCPPPEYEPSEHRYVFRLYALDETLSFDEVPTLTEVEAKANEHMIEATELIGRYKRNVTE